MPGFTGIRVDGLADLQRSFAMIDDGLKAHLTERLALDGGPDPYDFGIGTLYARTNGTTGELWFQTASQPPSWAKLTP